MKRQPLYNKSEYYAYSKRYVFVSEEVREAPLILSCISQLSSVAVRNSQVVTTGGKA